jgi:hypothetical protein
MNYSINLTTVEIKKMDPSALVILKDIAVNLIGDCLNAISENTKEAENGKR